MRKIVAILGFGVLAFSQQTPYFLTPEDNLQKVLSSLPPVSRVYLDEGVYRVNLFLANQELIIIGAGPDKTILEAENPEKPVIELFRCNIKLFKVTIKGGSIGLSVYDSEVSVSNASFLENGIGIQKQDRQDLTINSCRMENNKIGIEIKNATGFVKILKSQIINNKESGLNLAGSFFLTIEGCEVIGNKIGIGGWLTDSDIQIIETKISKNQERGIDMVTDVKRMKIEKTEIEENGKEGIFVWGHYGPNLEILDSQIAKNGAQGIVVFVSSLNIENSLIDSNSGDGIVYNVYKDFIIKNSQVSNNQGWGIRCGKELKYYCKIRIENVRFENNLLGDVAP
jgi:hypothetical protein